jgi:hypothetical protein
MNQNQLLKQMIDFNRTAFENAFSTMTMLQEQAEKATNGCLDQATLLPGEGKKFLNEWVAAFKKGRVEFKKMVDESYEKLDSYFVKVSTPAE